MNQQELKHENRSIVILPINKISPNPNPSRKYFDNSTLYELANSISEYGVIQPITVRIHADKYELISGERRLRASYLAGLKTIPAIILSADEDKSAALALLENLQRDDLSFFEVAESYKDLLTQRNFSKETLSKRLGKSKSSISEKLRLLHLPPFIRKFVRSYGLSEKHASTLLDIDDERLQIECIKFIHKNGLSPAQAKNLSQEISNRNQDRDSPIKISTLKEVRLFTNTLRKSLNILNSSGICATLDKSEDCGKIKYTIYINDC